MNNKTTAFNIWYEKIRPVIEKYASNYDVAVDSAYELLHLYSASCMVIQYCFESTTHKKIDPDLVCDLYATIFNSALDGYLTSPLNKTIKSILSKNTTITKEILDELKTEIFIAMAKSLGLLTYELINIVDETIKLSIFRSKYKPESHNIDYEYIRVFNNYQSNVYDGKEYITDKLMAYLMYTDNRSDIVKHFTDYYAIACTKLNDILRGLFVIPEYEYMVSYIKDVSMHKDKKDYAMDNIVNTSITSIIEEKLEIEHGILDRIIIE